MSLRRLRLGLLFALFLHHAAAIAAAPQAWAYMGWWLPDSWRSAPLGELDRLLFFEIKVDAKGVLSERNGWPEQWTDLRLALEQRGMPLDLTLTLFNAATFDSLFSSAEATQHLLDEAAALAGEAGVAGLQLDFEIYDAAGPAAIERYQGFVRELSKRLHGQSPPRKLSVFYPVGGDTALYDAATLAHVNQVVLQGYDSHWASGKTAGPVAPLDGNEAVTWKKALAQGIALGVPRDRLLLGFPLYGYEWQVKGRKPRGAAVGKAQHASFAPIAGEPLPDMPFSVQDRVRQYGATHEPVSASSYYQFKRKNGQFVEGWFEDWWSLKRKSDFLDDEQLGGIAFFMLGYDGNQLVDYFLRRRGPRK